MLILSSAPAAATILTSDDGKSVLTSDDGTRILTPDIIEAVYREHGPLLNRVAVNAYGEIGEDLLQDVFAQLVADPPAYKVRNPVGFLRKKLWFAFQHYLSRPLNHSENFKEFDDDAVVPPRQEIRVLLMEAWRALTSLQQGKLLQRETVLNRNDADPLSEMRRSARYRASPKGKLNAEAYNLRRREARAAKRHLMAVMATGS